MKTMTINTGKLTMIASIIVLLFVAHTSFGQVGIEFGAKGNGCFTIGANTYAKRNITNAHVKVSASERLDLVMADGMTVVANSKEGFVVTNRNAADTIGVAVITSLNAADEAASFTKVIRIAAAAHNTFVRYADLGLANGTVIYGHSVAGADIVPGVFQLSTILAPVASDVTREAVNNANGTGKVSIPALSATDLNIGGTIASYKLIAVPSVAQGVLYYKNGAGYVAAGEGVTLTAAQASTMKFDAADGYMGNAVFQYTATNNFGQVSNIAYSTIPVYTMPSAKAASKVNIYNW